MSEIVDRLNKTLLTRYGSVNEHPRFRVSWSDEQFEKRFGVYQEFSGTIFLREFRGLREVPKYPHVKHKWILERWLGPEVVYTPEIPETSQGSFEPIFVFMDDKFQQIPIIPEQVYRMIHILFHPQLPGDRASDMREQEKATIVKEIQETEEILADTGRSWIGHQLHSKEGIIRP